MDDFGERQALLTTDVNPENTLRYRLHNRDEDSRSDESCPSDEWWSDSSSCSSCDSDICSVADWQSEVNTLGELMYIESLVSEIDLSNSSNIESLTHQEETKNQVKTKKTSQNKLIRLIRRRNSGTRRSTRRKLLDVKDTTSAVDGIQSVNTADNSPVDSSHVSSNRVTFSDWPETELRTVQMRVFGENLGRRATLCESLLGLGVTTFPDNSNIVIANIVPNSEAANQHDIKIGDWLFSINGHQITTSNIDIILSTIIPPVEVTLGLQRTASNDAELAPSQCVRHQSELVRSLLSSNNTLKLLESNKDCLFSVMYLTHEGMSADEDETSPDQGVIYCYPPSPQISTLHRIRGAFITLNSLMKDAILSQRTPSEPVSSSVFYNGNLIHVIYCSENQELLLLCVPDDRCTLINAQNLTAEIVRCLKFKYQSLTRCFKSKEHIPLLEQFFSIILSRLYSSSSLGTNPHLVQIFPAAHWIPLPRDAQIQIDDALSELEANDFGSYINNNHGCQRLYSVIGTCLYHKSYLLSSHLARQDLVDVNSWCSQRGFLHLTKVESLASLVTWHEVYPSSCNRGLLSNVNSRVSGGGPTTAVSISNSSFPCPPNARWFLLIVGQGNSLLVVLLEAGGCSMEAVGVVGPDVYYVQQAQATLSHIHKIGVPGLADKWLSSAVRPQVVNPDCDYSNKTSPKRSSTDNNSNIAQQSKETSKSCENLQQSKLNLSSSSCNSKLASTSSLSSVIRLRNSPDNSINIISSHQNLLQKTVCPDEISEDSTRSSIVSDEVAPILGRRAERERERERATTTSDTNSHSRLSDSDFSDDSDWEPRRTLYGSRSLDMLMDLNKSKFSNSVSIIPSSLLAGKQNFLFHYVQLDKLEGIFLSPPNEDSKLPLKGLILEKFFSSAQSIHLLLQNTVHFKKLNAQEIHESLINKSLVAIKEYGMLFEAELEQIKKSSVSTLNFWVIGRVFFMPHAKEVYVCYEESAPQNMVEIAFRLALSASG